MIEEFVRQAREVVDARGLWGVERAVSSTKGGGDWRKTYRSIHSRSLVLFELLQSLLELW